MQKWITDGLMVGLATVAVGGGVSVLIPRNPGATLVGSGVGAAASSSLLARRHSRDSSSLEQQRPNHGYSLNAPPRQRRASSFQRQRADETSSRPFPTNDSTGYSTTTSSTSGIDRSSVSLEPQNDEETIAWLAAKNISVGDRRTTDPHVDSMFNKHAIFLGDHLTDENGTPLLAPLLKQIKWSISKNRGVQFHLKKAGQVQIRTLTQFCRNLKEDTLLSSYHYSKDQKIIHAVIQDRGEVRSFFNGDWFERFIYYKVTELLQRLGLSYSSLMNPIITFPNGDSFELDLLFLVEGKPLLIECKTGGDFNAHLKKFSDHRKRLSIPSDRAFLVNLEVDDAQTERLSQFWKFKVVNHDRIVSFIEAVVSQPEA